MRERRDPVRHALRVGMDDQVHAGVLGRLVPETDHLPELPGRVHVKQREGRFRRKERLLGEVQHHRGVLADRVEHHRIAELGCDFADDMDRLGFQPLEVRQLFVRHGACFAFFRELQHRYPFFVFAHAITCCLAGRSRATYPLYILPESRAAMPLYATPVRAASAALGMAWSPYATNEPLAKSESWDWLRLL
jgi:hypothetical protein